MDKKDSKGGEFENQNPFPKAWAKKLARMEEAKLRANFEDQFTNAIREDPALQSALEKVTETLPGGLKGDWSCCINVNSQDISQNPSQKNF